jgi:hypothetical protein
VILVPNVNSSHKKGYDGAMERLRGRKVWIEVEDEAEGKKVTKLLTKQVPQWGQISVFCLLTLARTSDVHKNVIVG